ncbi:MAG: transcriptional regulator [Intrasporangium sp.]|uniref:PaaX family transcriptional regulator n=1 Tax=Intrasporangium sp. TaxID=1925024 RepID=UPI0026483FA1|nr:PaaX family transcriptional regulator C-terminal domain-containing protein [Intrasporangium sp.]MDN5795319.1 transcriptional regulator [Intrasporangium sp.]
MGPDLDDADGVGDGVLATPVRPRAQIVTIYGLFARGVGGWISVGSLIQMMARLGVDEPAVRSAVSRLKRRGLLDPERRAGRAGYALSAVAREVLAEGDRRIFARTRASLEEGWVLAVFSVPETERHKRHTLRSRLRWLGYGTVGGGVWVAPGHLADETRTVLGRLGLADYVDLFRADYLGYKDLRAEAATWWDLDGLDALYREFDDTFGPALARWKHAEGDGVSGGGSPDDGAAFADHVAAVTAWRRLPFLDPGLAPELLPGDWMGTQAADTFHELHHRLQQPSQRFAASLVTSTRLPSSA